MACKKSETKRNEKTKAEITKLELDTIENDLHMLLERINEFIDDPDNPQASDEEQNETDDLLDDIEEACVETIGALDSITNEDQKNEINVDESEFLPPPINWLTLAPFIQNIVVDLEKFKHLKTMTQDVVERIVKMTENNILKSIEECSHGEAI